MSDELRDLVRACEGKGIAAHELASVMAACVQLGWVLLPPSRQRATIAPATQGAQSHANSADIRKR